MPRYAVDVKAFINITIEANNPAEARAAADAFVEWLSPTTEQLLDYAADHKALVDPWGTGGFDIDGESDVELAS